MLEASGGATISCCCAWVAPAQASNEIEKHTASLTRPPMLSAQFQRQSSLADDNIITRRAGIALRRGLPNPGGAMQRAVSPKLSEYLRLWGGNDVAASLSRRQPSLFSPIPGDEPVV